MSDIYQQSIDLHREHGGKLEVISSVALDTDDDLSLAYTPGVAGVSRAIADDVSRARELTIKRNTVAVVSDGSAVLGLGNIGPEAALPVMEGKAVLFKRFAGVDAFPICLGTQNIDEIVETVKRLSPTFGAINLEDISAPRCFEIEDRLRTELDIPVMHDDQHGTAIVVLAGLINAMRLRGTSLDDVRIVINGAGAAGIAIAELLIASGVLDIILVDSRGAVYAGRDELNFDKAKIATLTNTVCNIDPTSERCIRGSLTEALRGADAFIGVSVAGALHPSMISLMNKQPIIFAMANPEPEIMPDEARVAGAWIVATGRSDFPNQINNVLAFPGLFRGALDAPKGFQFSQDVFVRAAHALADSVSDVSPDKIIPHPFDESVAQSVARSVL